MADYDFEAWAQSRVASSKPNPNQQAAASMSSVGIGGLGGRTTTSSAQRVQDQFNAFREDNDRGSTYDYVPQTVTSGLGTPLSFKEKEKKDDRNIDQKIYDGMKAFGANLFSPRSESPATYVLDVYETSPMFRMPTVPEVTELGLEKSFEQRLAEMFDSQGKNEYTPEIEGTGSYDEVPAPSANQNLMRNRINSILKDVIAPNSKEYEIQKGDTLSDISLREGVSIDDLAQVNEIDNPNMILEGGTLIIPEAQEMEKAKEYVTSTQAALRRGFDRPKEEVEGIETADLFKFLKNPFGLLGEDEVPKDSELDPMSAQEASFDRRGIMTKPEFGPELYPSNERSMLTYVRDMFPNNPEAQAALATTIYHEGMKNPEEQIGTKGDYRLKKVITGAKNTPSLMRNDQKIYEVLGYPEKKDSKGNIVYLERPQKELNVEAQEALNKAGFDVGGVDGIVGPKTKEAIKKFQSKNKLITNGKLDAETYKKLGVENKELDHTGKPIAIREVKNPPKYIPADKAEAVFNIRYNDHYRGAKLGNVGDIEFAKYRGRGPVQITGIEMYRDIGNKIGVDLVANPDLILTDPEISRQATKAYLEIKNFESLSPEEAIKVINPGQSGILKKRKPKYNEFLKKLK